MKREARKLRSLADQLQRIADDLTELGELPNVVIGLENQVPRLLARAGQLEREQ